MSYVTFNLLSSLTWGYFVISGGFQRVANGFFDQCNKCSKSVVCSLTLKGPIFPLSAPTPVLDEQPLFQLRCSAGIYHGFKVKAEIDIVIYSSWSTFGL